MVKFVKANFKDEKDSKGNLSDMLSGPVVNIFSQEKGQCYIKMHNLHLYQHGYPKG